MSTSRTEIFQPNFVNITYFAVIFYLFQKESMIMQLLNDIVIF